MKYIGIFRGVILWCLVLWCGFASLANNCVRLKTKVLTLRFKIDSIQVSNSSSCLVCNGNATVWVSGGFVPYTYVWSNSDTTQSITGLCPGSYIITVIDANSDTIRGTCFVGPQSPAATDSTRSTCSRTGMAAVYVSGGTGQYTYSWSNGATGSQVTGVSAGAYVATITDSNGCACTDTAIVKAGLHFTLSGTNVTCNADSNGSATVSNVRDGTNPYTYSWMPMGGTNAAATGLLAGIYTVTITDSSGCASRDSITITQPPALITVYDTIADTGSCSGVSMLNITGGFAPYTFTWLPNVPNNAHASGSDTAFNLCHGTYFLCTTDSHGCSVCDSVYIRNAKLSGVNNLGNISGELRIYPNPADELLTVSLTGNDIFCNIEIDDVLGKIAMQNKREPKNGKITINVSGLPSGLYMLKINGMNHFRTKPFIINHRSE